MTRLSIRSAGTTIDTATVAAGKADMVPSGWLLRAISQQSAAAAAHVGGKVAAADGSGAIAAVAAESAAAAARQWEPWAAEAGAAVSTHDVIVFESHALQCDIRPLVDEKCPAGPHSAAAARGGRAAAAPLGKSVGNRQVLQRDGSLVHEEDARRCCRR